jgi:hypothetical protein
MAKHAYGREKDCTSIRFYPMWIAEPPPDHQSLDKGGQSPNKIGVLCSGGSTRGYFSLSLLNFLVNVMIFFFVRRSNDMRVYNIVCKWNDAIVAEFL